MSDYYNPQELSDEIKSNIYELIETVLDVKISDSDD